MLNLTENTFGGILGIIGTLVGVLVGAVLTYFVSLRVRKKERLVEGIYRPLLGQIGQISEKIENGEMPDLSGFEKIMQDGMYFIINEEIRQETNRMHQRLKLYKNAYDGSTPYIDEIIREEVEKVLPQLEDPERYRGGGYDVNYRAFIIHQFMGSQSLRDSVRVDKTPVEVLREMRLVSDSDIDSNIGGVSVERRFADAIAESVLERARVHVLIMFEKSFRQVVVRELRDLIEMLKKQAV